MPHFIIVGFAHASANEILFNCSQHNICCQHIFGRVSWFYSWVVLVLFVVRCCGPRVAPSCCLQLASPNCCRGGVFRSRSGWAGVTINPVVVGSAPRDNHVFRFQELRPTQFPLVERLGQSTGARPTQMSRETGGKFSQTKESQIVRTFDSHWFPPSVLFWFPTVWSNCPMAVFVDMVLVSQKQDFYRFVVASLLVCVVRRCSSRVAPFDGEVGTSGQPIQGPVGWALFLQSGLQLHRGWVGELWFVPILLLFAVRKCSQLLERWGRPSPGPFGWVSPSTQLWLDQHQ